MLSHMRNIASTLDHEILNQFLLKRDFCFSNL